MFRQLREHLHRMDVMALPYSGSTYSSQLITLAQTPPRPWTNTYRQRPILRIMTTLPEPMRVPALILLMELACCGSHDISTQQLIPLAEGDQCADILGFFANNGIILSGTLPGSVYMEPITSAMLKTELKCVQFAPKHLESFLHVMESKWPSELDGFSQVQRDSPYLFHIISALKALTELTTVDQVSKSGLNVTISLTVQTVRLLTDMGLYVKAEQMTQNMLEWGFAILSSDELAFSAVRRRLAIVERHLGRLQTAERIEYEILKLDMCMLGHSNVETMRSLNNYALALQSQSKFAEAKRAHSIALSTQEKMLGRNHPETLMSVNNLGQCLQNLGRHSSAEVLIRRALLGRQTLFTSTHPAVLKSMNDLGISYLQQHRYEEAQNIHQMCLFIRTRILGVGHPETIRSKNNLAIALNHRGRPEEAEILLREVVVDFDTLLGSDKPEAIKAHQNLARFLRDQTRFKEAEEVLQVCSPRAEQSLGRTHSRTVDIWRELAIVLHWQEKYLEALKFACRVKDVRIELFGYDHHATRDSIQHVDQLKDLL